MDVVDFLRARLDEDEAVARKAPARVLREVEAKRRIIQEHVDQVEMDDPCVPIVAGERPLRHLAAVYADHPDYDPEWAD